MLGMDALANEDPPSTAAVAVLRVRGGASVSIDDADEPVAYLRLRVIRQPHGSSRGTR